MLHPMFCRIAILFVALFGFGAQAPAETLRVGGLGAGNKQILELFAAYGRDEADLMPSLGTTGALRALGDGVLDIVLAGYALKPEHTAQGFTQVAAIRTPFGLITSYPDPVNLKSAEVADFFKSPKSAWPDGTRVRVILRPQTDTDTIILAGLFPGMAAAIEETRRRPEIPLGATDQDNAMLAERLPGSLTAATFSQINLERQRVRFVSIDGVEASLENLERGTYPYSRMMYFVLPAKKNPAAERFIAFLYSPAGEAALRATGSALVGN